MCPKGLGPTLEETVALLAARVRHLETLQYTAVASMLRDADGDTMVQVEESPDEDMVRMDVAGVQAFHLHDDGILDLARQSRCRAYSNATQFNIASAAYVKVNLNAENYDEQGEFDSAVNYRFTATEAGYYAVLFAITYDGVIDGKPYDAVIYQNGVEANPRARVHSGAAARVQASGGDIIYLAATDFIELWAYHEDGAGVADALGEERWTYMAVHKLS